MNAQHNNQGENEMTSEISPQHAAPWEDVSAENLEAERVAWNWKRNNGTSIPGKGAHRKESVVARVFRRIAA